VDAGAEADEADEEFGAVEVVAVVADRADLGVNSFEPRVFQAGTDGGDDRVLVRADRAGELNQRFLGPAAALRLAPAVIVLFPGAADVVDGAAGGPALRDGV
jgi:hypothetical protein